jgi:BCD family chlorophyll transporter-like MFS transporter
MLRPYARRPYVRRPLRALRFKKELCCLCGSNKKTCGSKEKFVHLLKNIRLGMLHAAVAVTAVPISGVLNRVMIDDLQILSSIVALLVVLPHLLAPIQVWIGNYSDQHPLWGYRRTPYIAAGLLLCIGGAVLTPYAALAMGANFWPGLAFAFVAFLLWGLGFNFAVVSYLSLAGDLSSEQNRTRTIAVMWFLMIMAVIATAIITGRALDPYSDEQLLRVFAACGFAALLLSVIGLAGLEPRHAQLAAPERRIGTREAISAIVANPQARVFFIYLMLLLSAILGQDVLLEPFGAQVFAMDVRATTQLTAIWGSTTLLALLLQGTLLSRWLSKKSGAFLGGSLAAAGLLLIAASGMLNMQPLFVPGVALLGFGTGIATATNLALMLDMTTPASVGLFIGAWGVADAGARAIGNLAGGVLRDIVVVSTGSVVSAYVVVFLVEAMLLAIALLLLRRIDVDTFRSERVEMLQVVAVAQ